MDERLEQNSKRPAGEGSRILVIDDEEVIHVSLKRILGRQGHHVDAVLGATEGLQLLERERYDLVITDLMMPDINGIQLLERVRDAGLNVPVLMITGYPSIRTAVQALRLGAADYLAKPFTRQELLGPVNRSLRGIVARESMDALPEEGRPDADGFAEPQLQLHPGERFFLRKHSWMVYQQDGTVQVGIERSFLDNIGTITFIDLPEETDLVEQGFTGIRLRTAGDEEHGVFLPLSGQVMARNEEAAAEPASIGPETWLLQILPVNLEIELSMLLKG
jgi:DNA-binding response OmpR family regulator